MVQSRKFQNLMLQRVVILEEIISLGRYPELPAEVDETISSIEEILRTNGVQPSTVD